MAKFDIEHKINQNTLVVIIGALFVFVSEYFKIAFIVWATGVVLIVPSTVSVLITLIAYTTNYWKKKTKI